MHFRKWKLKLYQDGQNRERKVELSRASSPLYQKEALIARLMVQLRQKENSFINVYHRYFHHSVSEKCPIDMRMVYNAKIIKNITSHSQVPPILQM